MTRTLRFHWPLPAIPMLPTFLAALLLQAMPQAVADFVVANEFEVESRPAVALNTQTGEFFVAYLEKQTDILGEPIELRVRRFNSTGAQLGSVLQPLGSGSHEALGRPAIAYGAADNVILVAVPERQGGFPDRVIARFLAADGSSLVGPDFLFDDGLGYYDDGQTTDGNGSLQITYNDLLNEFVVTEQRTVAGNNGLWAQKITTSGIGTAIIQLHNQGIHGQKSHDIEFASVSTTAPYGGRYLLVVNGTLGALKVLDANLATVTTVNNMDWGTPQGNINHHNIAFGRIEGKDRWMIVWADSDNCRPGYTNCTDPLLQWTGVWGAYIDPLNPNPGSRTAFPISKINSHISVDTIPTPRVGYNRDAETFYVAWRELPVLDAGNDQSLSHARGNRIDYFVEDGLPGIEVPLPYDNTVLSYVTGTCPPTGPCFSEQDPVFPDVSANGGFGGIAVWEEKYAPNPTDHDIYGELLNPPVPDNDMKTSAQVVVTSDPPVQATLVGSSDDGDADCGSAADEPDVWYRFAAPQSGIFIAATCGSNDRYGPDTGMDTVLSLHELGGTQIAGACNDDFTSSLADACAGVDQDAQRDSALALHMNAGQEILVRVSRYGGTYGGRFTLNYGFELDSDSDGDGIADPADNCIDVANPAQRDSDGDNIGNRCDADLNNDCVVNVTDLGLLKAVFFTADPDADFNGDGAVNASDLGIMKQQFFGPPGPSGLPNGC